MYIYCASFCSCNKDHINRQYNPKLGWSSQTDMPELLLWGCCHAACVAWENFSPFPLVGLQQPKSVYSVLNHFQRWHRTEQIQVARGCSELLKEQGWDLAYHCVPALPPSLCPSVPRTNVPLELPLSPTSFPSYACSPQTSVLAKFDQAIQAGAPLWANTTCFITQL